MIFPTGLLATNLNVCRAVPTPSPEEYAERFLTALCANLAEVLPFRIIDFGTVDMASLFASFINPYDTLYRVCSTDAHQ
jgi:hypothetical protein